MAKIVTLIGKEGYDSSVEMYPQTVFQAVRDASTNKTLQTLTDELVDANNYININDVNDHPTGYPGRATAVSYVPLANRKAGLCVTYKDASQGNKWIDAQFIGSPSDVSTNWTSAANWQSIGPVDSSVTSTNYNITLGDSSVNIPKVIFTDTSTNTKITQGDSSVNIPKVSVSQNTTTEHTDINIGSETTSMPSLQDLQDLWIHYKVTATDTYLVFNLPFVLKEGQMIINKGVPFGCFPESGSTGAFYLAENKKKVCQQDTYRVQNLTTIGDIDFYVSKIWDKESIADGSITAEKIAQSLNTILLKTSDVIDNTVSAETQKPLSANQGTTLANKLQLLGLMNFEQKGTIWTDGTQFDSSIRVSSNLTLNGYIKSITFATGYDGFIVPYDKDKAFIDIPTLREITTKIDYNQFEAFKNGDGVYYRLVVRKDDGTQDITIAEAISAIDIEYNTPSIRIDDAITEYFKVKVSGKPWLNNDNFQDVAINTFIPKTLYDDNCIYIQPSCKKKPVKLVVYCHGGSEYVGANPTEGFYTGNIDLFLKLGYAVLVCNCYPYDYMYGVLDIGSGALTDSAPVLNWTICQAYEQALAYVLNKYNIDRDNIFLLGFSQGGGSAENLAELSNIKFNAECIIAPALSLQFIETEIREEYARKMFGVSTPSDFTKEKAHGNDPYSRNVDVYPPFANAVNPLSPTYAEAVATTSKKVRNHTPLLILQGNADETVRPQYTAAYAKMIQNAGGQCEYILYDGFTHASILQDTTGGSIGTKGYSCALIEAARWLEKYGGYSTSAIQQV